ncbi:MAG: S9 family peptidase [Polymorphobacter sp.]
MTRSSAWRAPALVALLLLGTTAGAAPAPAPAVRMVGTTKLENVPAIPAGVSAAVQRFQNYRSATLQDWLADGSMLITTRFGATNQLHRVISPGGARTQLTFFNEPVASADTIPGSTGFVLSRDTGGDEWFQLYRAGLAGVPVALTEAGTRNGAPVIARDGALMLWARAVKGSGDYALLAANPADPASRRVIYQAQGAVSASDLSADKTQLLFERGISNRESQIFSLDIASGKARRLRADGKPARFDGAKFSKDGRSVLAISDEGSDLRRLVSIDIASGALTEVASDPKWDVEDFAVSDDGRILATVINVDGASKLVVRDFVTRRALPQPDLPLGVIGSLHFAPDNQRLGFSFASPTSAGDAWSWDTVAGTLTRWTTSELGGLDPATLATPQVIRFKSFDGETVSALVYRPQVPAGTRTPVIIDIHGGPEAQTRTGWNPGAQYFASVLGATVILPNVRGSDGYGTRFMNLDNAARREDSVKDIGALLDWVGKQPDMDAARVAVYGQSYGGYMSLAAMTFYSNRLVGGVERYGISNFTTFLQNTEAYRRDNRRGEYGDERDPAMAKAFATISPMNNLGKISKPMLVMQGANDPRVPASESEQVVAGLRASGVDTWYVLYADEGHGFMKKPNNDLRREVETVFLGKLFGEELR